jgi:CRP-like cAMP-binding protein
MPIRKELETITDLEAGARVIPAGSDLYRQGDLCSTYFIVLNGWIALSVLLDDGSCQILDFALPGAVLGFQSAPNAPMYHSARCLSLVRVYAFPRRKLDNIIETNPSLAVLLCRQITANEARAHDHLTNLGLRGARERIAHLLLEIYVRLRRRLPVEPGENHRSARPDGSCRDRARHARSSTRINPSDAFFVRQGRDLLAAGRLDADPERSRNLPGSRIRIGRPCVYRSESNIVARLAHTWVGTADSRPTSEATAQIDLAAPAPIKTNGMKAYAQRTGWPKT